MINEALLHFIVLSSLWTQMPSLALAQEAVAGNPYARSDNGSPSLQDCNPYYNEQQLADFIKSFKKTFEAPGSICTLAPGRFEKIVITKGQSFPESLALSEAIKKSQVLISGETHLFTDLKAGTDIINSFTALKGKKSCIAFELPQNEAGLDKLMEKLKAAAKSTRESRPQWQADERDDFIKYYDRMINFAKSTGAQIFGVDHPDNLEKTISNEARNKAMADNIGKLIKDNRCSAVLLFVGKAHETKGSNSDPAISTLLKKQSLQVSTVNLQMTNEYSMAPQIRTWDTCEAPKEMTKMTVLKSSEIPEGIKIAPRSGEAMSFQDFDFTLLVPFSQKDFPCSTCVN